MNSLKPYLAGKPTTRPNNRHAHRLRSSRLFLNRAHPNFPDMRIRIKKWRPGCCPFISVLWTFWKLVQSEYRNCSHSTARSKMELIYVHYSLRECVPDELAWLEEERKKEETWTIWGFFKFLFSALEKRSSYIGASVQEYCQRVIQGRLVCTNKALDLCFRRVFCDNSFLSFY